MSSHPADSPDPPGTPPTHGPPPPLGRPPNRVPLATGPHRMALLAFHPADRSKPSGATAQGLAAHEFATYVLVALWRAGQLLLVRVRERNTWELPGGSVEVGESTREAAERELWEETGLRLPSGALRLVGYARTAIGSPPRVLTGALFTGEIAEGDSRTSTAFVPNEEISEVCWWEGAEALPGLQTVDTYLADLTRPTT